MTRPFRVLTIDGGGIRGIVPATVLAAIEARRGVLAGGDGPAPLHAAFDLVVGTSTGAIIAAGLTLPRPDGAPGPATTPEALLALYVDDARAIFPRAAFAPIRWWRKLESWLRWATYSPFALEEILRARFGRGTPLGAARTRLVITAYDMEACRARFFRSFDPASRDLPAWKLVRGSTAGPTYFPPMPVANLDAPPPGASPDDEKHWATLVDGGVFANDPGLVGYVEALKLRDAGLFSADHDGSIEVISLGTGTELRRYSYPEVRRWGLLQWLIRGADRPLISAFMQAAASTASYQLNEILNPPGVAVSSNPNVSDGWMKPGAVAPSELRYIRIDGPLGATTVGDLDAADADNVARLRADARRIAADNADLIEEVARRLT